MKAIPITALLFVFTLSLATAQTADSTLNFATENVPEFKRQTILEEYEVPFDRQTDRKRMFRIGVNEGALNTSYYPFNSTPFEISYLQKMGKRSAVLLGVTGSYGRVTGTELYMRLGFRNYLKPRESGADGDKRFNFTGHYIGVEGSLNVNEFGNSFRISEGQSGFFEQFSNSPYYDSGTQLSFLYGLQLGGSFDFAVKAGLKYAGLGKVGDNFTARYNNPVLVPFISTNSLLSISFGGGGKKMAQQNCEFLNCNRQIGQMLKLDVSQLIYLDPYIGSVSIAGAYEKRIGRSNFASNTYSKIGTGYIRRFENNFDYIRPLREYGDGKFATDLSPAYNNKTYYDFTFNAGAGTELRFYPLKKREIINGKSVQNLNGLYLKVFGELSYQTPGRYVNEIVNSNKTFYKPQNFILEYGGGLGYQKKVGSKYFYDIFIDFRESNKNDFIKLNEQSIKFGTRFGFAK